MAAQGKAKRRPGHATARNAHCPEGAEQTNPYTASSPCSGNAVARQPYSNYRQSYSYPTVNRNAERRQDLMQSEVLLQSTFSKN